MAYTYVGSVSGRQQRKLDLKNIVKNYKIKDKMSQDIVADALNQIMNAKTAGKEKIEIARHSKFLIEILELAKKLGYISEYRPDKLNKKLEIKIGKLNECKAIKPRYNVNMKRIEKYIRRFLPSRNIGIIIISTSQGLMTHKEAIEKNIGGSLIAYFF